MQELNLTVHEKLVVTHKWMCSQEGGKYICAIATTVATQDQSTLVACGTVLTLLRQTEHCKMLLGEICMCPSTYGVS